MKNSRSKPVGQSKPTPACFACQWRDRSQWCALEPEEVSELSEKKSNHFYTPGQVVFNQGDTFSGIFCVSEGTVSLRRTDSRGNTILVRLCHAGDTIGYRDFFAETEFSVTAQAVSPTTLCFFPAKDFQALLNASPALGMEVTRRLAQDAGQAEEALLRSSTLPVRVRMAHLLLALKERYGQGLDDGTLRLVLPLSRQDIADLLGTRPETVARVIHSLEIDGVTRFSGRNVLIPDLDLLLDEVDPEE